MLENPETTEKIYISGIDWMISYMNWRSRSVPEKGNHFSLTVVLPENFPFARMREFIAADKALAAFLGGALKRPFPEGWLPQWQWQHGGNGICFAGDENGDPEHEMDNARNTPLPAKCGLRIWYCGREKNGCQQVVFTFTHKLFDGIGAERFIRDCLQMSGSLMPDSSILALPETDWQSVRSAGEDMRKYMNGMKKYKISRLPGASGKAKNSFSFLSLEPEKFAVLEKNVEKLYGPFAFSLWLLGVILAAVEKQLCACGIPGECFMIPMTVDMRSRRLRQDERFFNQWSMMPLLIKRDDLHGNMNEIIRMLRQLYMDALAARVPDMFQTAAQAMRFVPKRGIDMMVSAMPERTLGTLMFSFLNSTADMPAENLYHSPVMPRGSRLGFFANVCKGNLNLVVSERHALPAGAMAAVFAEIRKNMEQLTEL